MTVRYGYTVRWHKLNGDKEEFGVSSCSDPETARRDAEAWARDNGWTPRRWWQFWRWGEGQ